jgi:hypothetical protein
MALKFGSKAWRAKYLKKGKRKNAAKRKPAKRKTAKRGTTRRKNSPVRKNPPRSWTRVKAVRVVRKNGRDVLEIRK